MATTTANMIVNVAANTKAADTQVDESVKRTQAKYANIKVPGAGALSNSEASGTARGLGGLTGAASRDFASQAQGLGGLVRLYATYAANIFAVSAAFTALRSAMDTTNMLKGLEQLGIQSGTNLGLLSKRLVQATDGAISLKEAMTATAQATSAGLSADSVLRLGKAAKNTSLALGIEMTDAVSRITRGISKLEPELLDELGIFVRVDKVTQDYAKSVGKSALAISDFEKRAAFANAVLDQAEKKFGAVDIASNPYSQLLASVKNVIQSGLELVNTVLTPLLKLLASSPTALATVLAGIAGILLKQAIPAIGEFRAGMAKSADVAAAFAKRKADDAVAAKQSEIRRITEISEAAADREVNRTDIIAQKIEAVKNKKFKEGSVIRNLLDTPARDVTDEQLNKARATAKGLETKATNANSTAQLENVKAYKQAIAIVEKARDAEIAHQAVVATKTAELEKQSKGYGVLGSALKNAESARIAAVTKGITANAAYTGSTVGVTAAFKEMNKAIAAEGVTGIKKFTTQAVGGFGAVAGAAGTIISSLGGVLTLIGIVVSVVGLLSAAFSTAFSTNGKEAGAYAEKLSDLESNTDMLGKTIDNVNSKPFLQQISAASLEARSNAITAVIRDIDKTTEAFDKSQAMAGRWDKITDGFFDFFGRGEQDKLEKQVKYSMNKIAQAIEESPISSETQKFGKRFQEIQDQLKRSEGTEAYARKLKEFGPELAVITMELGKTADASKQLNASTVIAGKALTDIQNSFRNKEVVALFGTTLIDMGVSMSEALKTPETALRNLVEVSEDASKLALFTPEDRDNILAYKNVIDKAAESFEEQTVAIKQQKQALKDLEKQKQELIATEAAQGSSQDFAGANDTARQISAVQEEIESAKKGLVDAANKLALGKSKFAEESAVRLGDLAIKQFKAGSNILASQLEASFAKGSTALSDAVFGALGNLPGVATAKANIEQGKLAAEKAGLEVQKGLIVALRDATLASEKNTAEQAVANAQAKVNTLKGDSGNKEGYLAATKILESAEKSRDKISGQSNYSGINAKDIPKEIRRLSGEIGSTTDAVSQKIAKDAIAHLNSIAGVSIQIQSINDKSAAVKFTATIQENKAKLEQVIKTKDDDIKKNQETLDSLKNIESTYGYLDEVATKEKNNAQINLATLAKQKEEQTNLSRIAEIQLAINTLKQTAESKASATAEIKRLEDRNKLAEKELNTKKQSLELNEGYQVALQATKASNIVSEKAAKVAEYTNTLAIQSKEIALEKLNIDKLKGGSDESELAAKTALIEKEKLDLELQQASLILAEKQRNLDNTFKEDTAKAGADSTRAAEIEKAYKAESSAIVQQQAGLTTLNGLKKQGISLTAENTEELIKQTKAIDNMKGITESLSTLFGDLGQSIGEAGEALLKMANDDAKYLREKKRLEKDLADVQYGPDVEATAKATKKLANLEKQNAKAQVSNIQTVAKSTKKMFDEKSAGYKVIEGVEKAAAVYSAALRAKELVDFLATNNVRITSLIPTIYATATAQLGPIAGPIAATAAIAAFVGSAFSGGGGGSSGPSIEDVSAAAGTGQSYNGDGNLVSNGGGIYGDPTAKVESIVNAIDKLAVINYDMLDFGQNETYKALLGIKNNTEKFVSYLATTSTLKPGGTEDLSGNTPSALNSALSNIPLIGSLLGGLFGGQDVNLFKNQLLVKGSLGGLSQGNGTFASQQTYKVDTKGLFGSRTDINKEPEKAISDPKLQGFIANVLKSTNTTIISFLSGVSGLTGTALETYKTEIASKIGSEAFDLNIDIKGKTPTQIVEDLLGDLGTRTDAILAKYSPQLVKLAEDFRGTAESMTDFATRVINEMTQVSYAFESISKSVGTITPEMALGITEAAGGLENLLTYTDKFADLFLTEAERLVPVTNAVAKELVRLGASTVTTRKDFKDLILGLDLSTQSGKETYVALLKLAPAFDAVVPAVEETAAAVEKLLTAVELAAAQNDQNIKIMSLLGDKEGALAATREKELAGMDKRLVSTQKYIYALEDLVAAEDKYKAVLKTSQDKNFSLEQTLLTLRGEGSTAIARQFERDTEGMTEAQKKALAAQASLNKARQQEIDFINQIKSLAESTFSLQNELITAQGAATPTGGVGAAAEITARTRTRDLAKMTEGLSEAQAAAVTKTYDYNLAIKAQTTAQTTANAANAAASEAKIAAQTAADEANKLAAEAVKVANEEAAQASADAAKAAAEAAQAFKDSWQEVADSIFDEIKRIRGIMEPSVDNLSVLQEKFNKAAIAAKAGDSEAAKLLPELSQSILAMTEQTAGTSLELKRSQANIAGSLEDVGDTIVDKFGLFGPEDAAARAADALARATASNASATQSSAAASQAAAIAAQATADAAQATADVASAAAASSNAALLAASAATDKAKEEADEAIRIAEEKGIKILTAEEKAAQDSLDAETAAYATALEAKKAWLAGMQALDAAFYSTAVSNIVAGTAALSTAIAASITAAMPVPVAPVAPVSTVLPGDQGPQQPNAYTASIDNINTNKLYDYKYSDFENQLYNLPKFDVGTDYVPQDMIAMIHEGEKITPKAFNNDNELINEIRALRAEVASLRASTDSSGVYIKRTSDTLNRVTLGGNSIYTTAA